ncbi:MAG: M56 family metallopeptidase [Candidatus Sulfotelmatobacter sp.]|jgi:bla regulator protein blaR1
MMWPQLQTVAQIATGRFLNSLPEGLLIALFAGVMLRLLPRQNSGTRFAVWFVALLAVAGLPLIGDLSGNHSLLAAAGSRPLIALSARWGLALFLAWVLAAVVGMLRLASGLWRLRGLRKSCMPIDVSQLDPAVQKTIDDFRAPSSIPRLSILRSLVLRSVTIATSEHVSVPAAIGFFKPMIVIPAWALRELTPEELNVILLHEFAHLRRWDDWTNLLQRMVRAVLLFHPAVWWIERRLTLEREMACDDVVLATTANPRGYAKCLIALLEKSVARRGWAMAQAAVNRAREASLRLSQILDVSRPATRDVWKPALGLVGIFSLVCMMAVPHVPQFVAFEGNSGAVHADDLRPLAMSPSQFPAAVVIPAALHVTSSSPFEKMHVVPIAGKKSARRLSDHSGDHRLNVAPPVVSAKWITKSGPASANVSAAAVRQTAAQMPQTLLLIRTTERVGPDSWVWSVTVWRVTWTNPAQKAVETGFNPKKT